MTNPILGELNNLSPGAKAALAAAHGQATSQAAAAPKLITDPSAQQLPPAIGAPGPAMAKLGGAPPMPPSTPANIAAPPASSAGPTLPMMSAAAPIQAPKGTSAGDQQERARLLNTGSGIGQIKNPFLRGLAEVGNTVGHFAAPGIMTAIPGTAEHHQSLLNQNAGLIAQDQKIQGGDIANREKSAQAANLEAQPELNQAKLDQKNEHEQNTVQHQTDTLDATLREHGFKHDENGQLVPLDYSEMSPQQQAVSDLKSSQEELAKANADLKTAQKNNMPMQMQMAQQRIDTANKNAQTAAGRLGLSGLQYNMRAHGTDGQGNALPGAALLDDDTPVGTAFQQNVRPTGTERNKGDMAQSAHEQLGTLKSIVDKRPDIFGPAQGRKTDFTVWLGSQDPDAQRFRAARTIAGDHLAGTFGGRSEAALSAIDDAIGHFKDNPKAISAGLDQLDKANNVFLKRGAPRVSNGKGGTIGAVGTDEPPAPSGQGVSLKAAMALPINKGKSEADVRKDIESHGHKVMD